MPDFNEEDYDHVLKTINPYFQLTWVGTKNFEIRDATKRIFEVGQRLLLKEYLPSSEVFTGRAIEAQVTSVIQLAPMLRSFGYERIVGHQLAMDIVVMERYRVRRS